MNTPNWPFPTKENPLKPQKELSYSCISLKFCDKITSVNKVKSTQQDALL